MNLLPLALKKYNIEEEKVLILITSLMAWNQTPKKLKEVKDGKIVEDEAENPEGEENKEQDEGAQEDKRSEANQSRHDDEDEPRPEGDENGEGAQALAADKEPPKPKQYAHLPYQEDDYKLRIPGPEYEEIKRIEDEILEFKKENVKTYVISSGIMYGKGESIFNNHFKKAWL